MLKEIADSVSYSINENFRLKLNACRNKDPGITGKTSNKTKL